MKRPVMTMLLALMLGECAAIMEGNVVYVMAAAAIITIPSALIIKAKKVITGEQCVLLVMTFLSFILGAAIMNYETALSEWVYSHGQSEVKVSGYYSGQTKTEYGYVYYLKNTRVMMDDCVTSLQNIMVYADEGTCFSIGNKVMVSGKIKHFDEAQNLGNFDAKKYYRSLGIYVAVDEKSRMVMNYGRDDVREIMCRIRKILGNIYDIICNDGNKGLFSVCDGMNAATFKAVTLGDRSELGDEVKNMYQINGISHILAVSSLHITTVGVFIYGLLRRRMKFVGSGCVAIIVVLCFMFMTGEGISSVRAAGMFIFYLFAQMAGVKYDPLNSMAFVGYFMCVDNPFVLFNTAFQMSFMAILAVMTFMPVVRDFLGVSSLKITSGEEIKAQKYTSKKLKLVMKNLMISALNLVVTSISINILLMPILAFNYYEIAPYSVILNIVVIPLMSVVISLALISSAVVLVLGKSFIVMFAARIVILPACLVLRLYDALCGCFSKIPGCVYITGKPEKFWIIAYYVVFILFFIVMNIIVRGQKDKKESFTAGRMANLKSVAIHITMFLIAACILTNLITVRQSNNLEFIVNNVGQGECLVLKKDGFVVMVDGGSTDVKNVWENRIRTALMARRIANIDYLFITHTDNDHISGIITLLEDKMPDRVRVNNLVLPCAIIKDEQYEELVRAAAAGGVSVRYVKKGDRIRHGGLEIKCLYPLDGIHTMEKNDCSTILDIRYGRFKMLLTGDISAGQEQYFMNEADNGYTLLKVAHHGSKYSTSNEFVDKVRPQYAVISCGKNNSYGHPHEELLKRLEETKIFRTDEDGQIVFATDGVKLSYTPNSPNAPNFRINIHSKKSGCP